MRYLVLDRQLDCLLASQVRLGEPPELVARAMLDPVRSADVLDELADGCAALVHRFPYAPDDVGEVVAAAEPEALLQAGRAEHAKTAARVELLADCRRRWPNLPQPLVFDTPFFRHLPDAARCYAIPPELAAEHGLYRLGRHGAVHRLAVAETEAVRVVSVVVDREASVAALVEGEPVEVSAGLTALEGIPGGVTCGDVDAAVVLYLVDALGRSVDEAERALAVEGGLTGLSGGRETLRELRRATDASAELAIAQLVHRVKRYIGEYTAVMGGLEALVFCAERDYDDEMFRQTVVEGLGYLGVGDTIPVLSLSLGPATAAAVAAAEACANWVG